jgi:DNA-binding MarR family transcriptional regulator
MGELAKRMVDRGLLERVEGAGRKVQHELTATGEELRKAGGDAVDGVLTESLGRLDADEREVLYRLLLKAAAPLDSGGSGA